MRIVQGHHAAHHVLGGVSLLILLTACSAPPQHVRRVMMPNATPIMVPVFVEADAVFTHDGEGEKTLNGKAVVVPDITGDGKPDLVLGARPRGNESQPFDAIYVIAGPLEHGSAPSLAAEVFVPPGTWRLRTADFVDAGDLDGDGYRDLIAWISLFHKQDERVGDPRVVAKRRKKRRGDDTYPGYYLLRGPLEGNVPLLEGELFASSTVAKLTEPGDIDVDGDPDIVLLSPGEDGRGDVAGIISAPISKGIAPSEAPHLIVSGNDQDSLADVPIAGAMGHCDVSGDGKDDVITWTNTDADAWRQVNIHHSPLPARQSAGDDVAAIYELGTNAQTVVCLGNVDKRAGEDILVGNEKPGGVEDTNKHRDRLRPLDLYLFMTPLRGAVYPADATVQITVPDLTIYGFNAAGDFDGDGRLDLVVWGESGNGTLVIAPITLRQILEPTALLFVEIEDADPTAKGWGVDVADIDGDAYPDLIVGVPAARRKARVLVFSGADLIAPGSRAAYVAPEAHGGQVGGAPSP